MRFVCFLYIHIHCTFLYICLNKAINKTLSQHFDVFKSKSWHCYSKIKWLDIYIYRRIFRIRMNSLTHLTHSKLICFHSAWKFSFMLEWSQYLPLFRFISFLHSPILLLFFLNTLDYELNWTELNRKTVRVSTDLRFGNIWFLLLLSITSWFNLIHDCIRCVRMYDFSVFINWSINYRF